MMRLYKTTHRDNWGLRINPVLQLEAAKQFYKNNKYNKGSFTIMNINDSFTVSNYKVFISINGMSNTFDIKNNDDKLFLFNEFINDMNMLSDVVDAWEKRSSHL